MDILTYGIFDLDVLVLYAEAGQTSHFALQNLTSSSHNEFGTTQLSATCSAGTTTFTYTQGAGMTVLQTDQVLIYLLDQPTAWKFWAPPTTASPDVNPNEQIFVLGPYLVRNASISHEVVHISGDNDDTTTIEVYTGDPDIQTIDWNGLRLDAKKTLYGSVTAQIPGSEGRPISLPPLTK